MLLDWLGRRTSDTALTGAAARIEHAVDRVLDDPQMRTRDVGGALGTDAFAQAVVAAL
jgi:3-isopropylmalate dehydrogenase